MQEPTTLNGLCLGGKARAILEHGIFVSKCKFYQVEMSLYKYDTSFIEISYDLKRQTITDIQPVNQSTFNSFLKYFTPLCQN